jgi:hypothetical protein
MRTGFKPPGGTSRLFATRALAQHISTPIGEVDVVIEP